MTKKVLRRIAAVLLAVLMVAGTTITAFAETSQYVPYENYTYWQDISGKGRKLVFITLHRRENLRRRIPFYYGK